MVYLKGTTVVRGFLNGFPTEKTLSFMEAKNIAQKMLESELLPSADFYEMRRWEIRRAERLKSRGGSFLVKAQAIERSISQMDLEFSLTAAKT